MFEYAKFLSKRVFCRKSNILLILLPIIIMFIFLIMNINSQDNLRDTLKYQIKTDMEVVETYTNKLAQLTEDSKEYKLGEATIEFAKSNAKTFHQLVSYVDHKEWPQFYESYYEVLNNRIQQEEENAEIMGGNNEQSLSSTRYSLLYIQYLQEHNLVYEESDFPIRGLSFITSMMQIILPILITIICVYILSQVFTLDYSKENDISMLLHLPRGKVMLTKILVGISFSILVYVVILCSSFLLATLLSGDSGWKYPIILMDHNTNTWYAITTFVFFKNWMFLGILFTISLTLFSYLTSIVAREDVYLFFIVICIVLGIAYVPTVIESMKLIANILPTTYMNCVNVASGNIATQYANPNINVSTGILVLTISIVIQAMLCVLYNKAVHIHLRGNRK